MNNVPAHLTDSHLNEVIAHGSYGGEKNAAQYLLKVPAEDRVMIKLKANEIGNMSAGWNHSGAVAEAVRQYLASPNIFRMRFNERSKRTAEIQAWEQQTHQTASLVSWKRDPGSPIDPM